MLKVQVRRADESRPAMITILSMNGAVMKTEVLKAGSTKTTVNVAGLAAGIYIVRICGGGKSCLGNL